MNTFRIPAAVLFSLAMLAPAGCVLSDAPEGDDLALSTDEVAAESLAEDLVSPSFLESEGEDVGTEAACLTPLTYLGSCADWGNDAFESSQCGRGLHTWKYQRCKQYRTSNGELYRAECGSDQLWCDYTPQPGGTNPCRHTCS